MRVDEQGKKSERLFIRKEKRTIANEKRGIESDSTDEEDAKVRLKRIHTFFTL